MAEAAGAPRLELAVAGLRAEERLRVYRSKYLRLFLAASRSHDDGLRDRCRNFDSPPPIRALSGPKATE